MVMRENWMEFVRCFPEDFGDPEEFREFCHQVAGGKERRRETDREAGAPMSPYNRRTYRMTFYGIRDLLHPLVVDGAAVALPMQHRAEERAWLMEVCPACTLKEEGLYRSYKGPEERCRDARREIAGEVSGWGISFGGGVRERVVDDRGGDGLDAVLAAFAAFRGLEREEFWCLGDLIEGCIVH